MSTLLHLDSSPLETAISRELGREFVKTWKAGHNNGTVIYRDLVLTPLKPLDATWIGAAYTPAESRTTEQDSVLALSGTLISELERADEYVIGVAMHNFTIPSALKLWIDQIARSGETFSYGAEGPKGLLTGKNVQLCRAVSSNDYGIPWSHGCDVCDRERICPVDVWRGRPGELPEADAGEGSRGCGVRNSLMLGMIRIAMQF